ncbi:MAG: hypothetical protein ACW99U_14715 [Candidatus Thorarchaeota archaeon]|jgi:hypothetical protein
MQDRKEVSDSTSVIMKVKRVAGAVNDHCLLRTRLDFLCDECNGKMRPGGRFQTKIGTREYQFCSENCMEAYVAKTSQAS